MTKLEVFVTDDCWTCDETDRIVSKVAVDFPTVDVEVINARTGRWPNNVFASPTYMLNGRIISLGNPSWATLCQQLASTPILSSV